MVNANQDMVPVGLSSDRPSRRLRRLNEAEIDDLVNAFDAGTTILDLAAQFGINRSTVLSHLRRRQVARRTDTRRWTLEELDEAINLYESGESVASVGKRFGLNPSTVSKRLHRAGVKLRPRPGRA